MNKRAIPIEPDKLFRLIFGSVFGLVGVGLLAGATILYLQTKRFLSHSINVTGTVIALERSVSRSSKGGTSVTYAPTVRYTAADGEERIFTSTVSSSPPSFREGQQVPVLYDPVPPNPAEINDFVSLHFSTLICGILGTIFTAVGGLVAFIRFKHDRQMPSGVPRSRRGR